MSTVVEVYDLEDEWMSFYLNLLCISVLFENGFRDVHGNMV